MELDTNIYTINEIDKLLDNIKFIKNNRKIEYANVPAVVDIETSSFYENGQKRGIMYVFVFGINGKCIIGRTYDELLYLFNYVSSKLSLDITKRMIFYVHNLSYEFQFFRKHFTFESVFGISERKVAYAMTNIGIEFRCSYLLSGYSLSKVGDILTTYKVNKKVGDLDYSKIRHRSTPLTDTELGYVLYDGIVVMAYIQEEIERNKNNINYIALTKTGKVRDYCRKQCLYDGKHDKKHSQKFYKYRQIMNALQISSVQEYKQLRQCFMGGFTHANAYYVNKVLKNVTSYDFTSSYPYVMVSEQFPMSKGELIEIKNMEEFERNLRLYCCLFHITLKGLKPSTDIEYPISQSKCLKCINPIIDNGRVVEADEITMYINEVNFSVIRKFYKWDEIKVKNFRRYRRGYLPTNFIKSILKLYQNKTTLKGVEGKEIEYLVSKENVNSCYGMCVTDICREEITYNDILEDNGGWESTECDYVKALERYNKSVRRFISYPWGIWVTSYAQRNLLIGNSTKSKTYCVYNAGNDYVYCDTDSIKALNIENHLEEIKRYNEIVELKLKKAMQFHNLPFDMVAPKTIEGKIKMLGVFDYDGFYLEFKTLGAKRYVVKTEKGFEYENKTFWCPYSLTISGVNKNIAIPYLYRKYSDNIMNEIKDGLFIPKGATGKNTHTYIDTETEGYVEDYLGNRDYYHEYTSIHMEECEYELSLSKEFIEFLEDIEEYIE